MRKSGREDFPVVSILVPAFNEELTIEQLILRTRQVLEKLNLPHEIIVVDDGSSDRTAFICKTSGAKVVRNGCRMGKGMALRKAFSVCHGDVIVTLDADGSHQPEEIPRLIAPILSDCVDFTLGSRMLNLGSPLRVRFSHLGNLIFSLLISLFSQEKVSDLQSGFRAVRSNVIKGMHISCRRFEIESEMLIKLLKKKCRFVEVPVTSKFTGSSNINVLGDGFLILRRILFCVAS